MPVRAPMKNSTGRLRFTLFACFLLAGCAVPGERALDGGGCPAGETCSSWTPDGLSFMGAPMSDVFAGGGVPPIAAGGKQTVTALIDSGNTQEPYAGFKEATTPMPRIASIDAVAPPTVVVQGNEEGTTKLRLLQPGTNILLDRVDIQVAPIKQVTLFPKELVIVSDPEAPWAVLANSEDELVTRLWGDKDLRLVDETISLTPATGQAQREAWDLFKVTAPASGTASYQVKTWGATFTAEASVVSKIDSIELSQFLITQSEPIKVDTTQESPLVCFTAMTGGAAVAGATWKFTSSPGVEVLPASPDKPDVTLASCTVLKGVASGPATITVEASGVQRTFNVTVSTGGMKAARHPAPEQGYATLRATMPVVGERAELLGGL